MFWLNILSVVMQAIQLGVQLIQFISEQRKQK